ncbi:hypothetical protein ABZ801_34250 [Actinomadura sp. NPDC047616]|uniref:hypothetical protein n=1 Tax=Actinomadura sp. NPDC047616 TaxID=3155914 RepID=UPI0033CB7C7F
MIAPRRHSPTDQTINARQDLSNTFTTMAIAALSFRHGGGQRAGRASLREWGSVQNTTTQLLLDDGYTVVKGTVRR